MGQVPMPTLNTYTATIKYMTEHPENANIDKFFDACRKGSDIYQDNPDNPDENPKPFIAADGKAREAFVDALIEAVKKFGSSKKNFATNAADGLNNCLGSEPKELKGKLEALRKKALPELIAAMETELKEETARIEPLLLDALVIAVGRMAEKHEDQGLRKQALVLLERVIKLEPEKGTRLSDKLLMTETINGKKKTTEITWLGKIKEDAALRIAKLKPMIREIVGN